MNNKFGKGAVIGSIVGASAGVYAASKMNWMQKKRIARNTKKAFSNMKSGMSFFK